MYVRSDCLVIRISCTNTEYVQDTQVVAILIPKDGLTCQLMSEYELCYSLFSIENNTVISFH